MQGLQKLYSIKAVELTRIVLEPSRLLSIQTRDYFCVSSHSLRKRSQVKIPEAWLSLQTIFNA